MMMVTDNDVIHMTSLIIASRPWAEITFQKTTNFHLFIGVLCLSFEVALMIRNNMYFLS